ncbi:hypothetical protein U1Q18_044835 [Sarracenia purpurea var. burkii]
MAHREGLWPVQADYLFPTGRALRSCRQRTCAGAQLDPPARRKSNATRQRFRFPRIVHHNGDGSFHTLVSAPILRRSRLVQEAKPERAGSEDLPAHAREHMVHLVNVGVARELEQSPHKVKPPRFRLDISCCDSTLQNALDSLDGILAHWERSKKGLREGRYAYLFILPDSQDRAVLLDCVVLKRWFFHHGELAAQQCKERSYPNTFMHCKSILKVNEYQRAPLHESSMRDLQDLCRNIGLSVPAGFWRQVGYTISILPWLCCYSHALHHLACRASSGLQQPSRQWRTFFGLSIPSHESFLIIMSANLAVFFCSLWAFSWRLSATQYIQHSGAAGRHSKQVNTQLFLRDRMTLVGGTRFKSIVAWTIWTSGLKRCGT